ncbi:MULTISPECIES: fimbria/pilus outer membrane usher protein [Rahnella]|uniref:fimbria/pilus outer membrane usher protein n=1 Tax=Rahnella TaxID=34037 RepID=UPI003F6DAB81
MENNNIKNRQDKDNTRRKGDKRKSGAFNGNAAARSFLLKPLSFFILLSLPGLAFSAETFNAEMLKAVGDGGDMENVNLDYFAEKGGQMPGTYQVDIYLNNQQVDSRNVEFVSLPDAPGKLYGAITPAEMAEYGVKLDAFPDLKAVAPDAQLTKPLSAYVPQATENLDINRKRYDITVPQIGVNMRPRNSVDPKRWDNGIAAFMLNYSYSGSTTQRDDSGQSKSNFVNLRSGANLGAWRLRNYSTYSNQQDDGSHGGEDTSTSKFESINTYVQRDVRFLQGGQLTLGEYSTPADVFDSIQFTGAQLASDDQMLPDSMSQFAPTVRGIAKSNAQVTIKQNGYVIYQSNVSPGPFAITDLYPSGNGGDMEVTVTESDGSTTKFNIATSSVPILQREGRFKYNLALGKYRSGNDDTQTPNFIQLSNIYGLTARTTVYGGVQYAENYRAANVGVGFDLGSVGAVSFDATQATSEFDDALGTKKGQSYRAMYAKNFEATDTNLQIAGYRYSTEGYYAFNDVQDYQKDTDNDFDNYNRSHNQRSKMQLSVNQSIGDYGSIYVSGSQQDYWGGDGKEKLLQLGYNTSIYGISYGFNYNYSKNPGMTEADQVFAFNMSVPLDKFMGPSGTWATYNMSTKRHGSTVQQAGISGTLLDDKNLSYSAQQGYENQGSGASGNASMDYKGGSGEGSLGYSYDQDTRQWSYGIQGGVLIHENGITLSQPLGDTIALVKAPGADDVDVENNSGVHTDWRGYAVVPYAQPYRKNSVTLETESFADDVDMDMNTQTVIPTRGAVVRADFKTRVGQRALVQMLFMGKPVPFGATVSLLDNDSTVTGIVSDNGEVYLTGLPETGNIMAKWGNGSNEQCKGAYTLAGSNASDPSALIKQITAQCH